MHFPVIRQESDSLHDASFGAMQRVPSAPHFPYFSHCSDSKHSSSLMALPARAGAGAGAPIEGFDRAQECVEDGRAEFTGPGEQKAAGPNPAAEGRVPQPVEVTSVPVDAAAPAR